MLTSSVDPLDCLLADCLVDVVEPFFDRIDCRLAGRHRSAEQASLLGDGLAEHVDIV